MINVLFSTILIGFPEIGNSAKMTKTESYLPIFLFKILKYYLFRLASKKEFTLVKMQG